MADNKFKTVTFDNKAFKIDSDESKKTVSNRYRDNNENEIE